MLMLGGQPHFMTSNAKSAQISSNEWAWHHWRDAERAVQAADCRTGSNMSITWSNRSCPAVGREFLANRVVGGAHQDLEAQVGQALVSPA
jgi:hypothetical protein